MEVESCVPPGFRFHPTEEELVGYYLARKVASLKIDIEVIADIDLYRIEPWDLQDRCKHEHEDQNEWYFFSHKDKKYPTGTRTNRATASGFWKATGRDKAVVSKSRIIGMRKTLVFYQGRAPNGRKTDWIMHEYRLQSSENTPPQAQEEGWVVCRAFRKPAPSQRQSCFTSSCSWNQASYYIRDHEHLGLLQSPADHHVTTPHPTFMINSYHQGGGASFHEQLLSCGGHELESKLQLPHLFKLPPHLEVDSPNMSAAAAELDGKSRCDSGAQFVDWKALDRLLGSHLNDSTSSSSSSLPLINLEYEADAQNNGDQYLASFSDL